MDKLDDKVALVTGGGSGINLAFVKLLVHAGCRVLIADLSLHPQAQEYLASLPPRQSSTGASADAVHFQKTDVTDWSQLARAFDACRDRFGDMPDIVVPGAGVYEPSSNSFWKDCDEGSHYKLLDVNLAHPIKASRMAIRGMTEAGKGGSIIHVSSISGQRSSIVSPLYTAAKHGINSFVRGMAPLEGLAGIRVTAVAPGTVKTPLFTEHPEASKFLDPQKDFLLPPEEVAQAMFALLTDPKYKTGTVLEVCDLGNWREVSLLNDPGPQGPASLTSRKKEAVRDILPYLASKDGKGMAELEAIMND